jgi:hypothetical protein
MHGEVIKAEFIVNRNPYLGTMGPKARIITSMREVWWVQQGSDGLLEMVCMGLLSDNDFEREMK